MLNLITMPLNAAIRVLAFAEHLIVSVLNMFLRLFGMQMPVTRRTLPVATTAPPDILAEIQSQISSAGAGEGKLLKPTSEAGRVLHRFALARSVDERASMDLSMLTPEQQNWMLLLSDGDLERLAEVGLDGCTRAISGKRFGIGGLPAMRDEKPVEPPQPMPTSPLARRVHAYKQATFA